MELENVSDVIIGILVNREQNETGEYIYNLFNLKNYEEGINKHTEIRTKSCFDKKLTKREDIIFRLVYPNKIIYIDEKSENLLVPSQMCIIRVNKEIIDPIFLKWYLESDICKKQLLLNITGSSIQKISVNALRKIKIPDLELEKQKKIRDLINLWDKEKEIMGMIIDRKERLYNSIIEEIIEGKG